MMTNPYQPPQVVELSKGNFGEHSKLIKRSFLYREIELYAPVEAFVVYNGWNFLQRIFINETLVWKRISWVVIHKYAAFQFPQKVDSSQRWGEMRITFGRALSIKRFTISFDGSVVYEEWN